MSLRSVRLVAMFALTACATAPHSWSTPAGPYGQAFEAASRSGVVRGGLETQAIVNATYETPAFRKARADQLATIFDRAPADAEAQLPQLTAPTEGPTFIVSFYSAKRDGGELDRPESAWGLSLAASSPVPPLSIKRLDESAALHQLFPYTDPYSTAYRVVFPATVSADHPTLVLSGVRGEARLAF